MHSEEIIEKVKQSLGEFCYTECKAFCCRKGYLVLKNEELDNFVNGRKEELEREGILMKGKNGNYYVELGKKGCPNLNKDFKCKIYSKRPSVCRQFPLMNSGKYIIIPDICPLAKEQKLYPLIR